MNSRALPAMPRVGQEWCRTPWCQLEWLALNPTDDRGGRTKQNQYGSDRSKNDRTLATLPSTNRIRASRSPRTLTVLWHDKSPTPVSRVGYVLARI